jgi:hypothetical protein
MKTESKPIVRISYAVEFEVCYDPFKGNTPEKITDLIEDQLHVLLMEASPDILSIYTSITDMKIND